MAEVDALMETAALFVYHANADRDLFGDIGRVEKVRESSLAGLDRSFVICCTSLSVAGVRTILDGNDIIMKSARSVLPPLNGPEAQMAPTADQC